MLGFHKRVSSTYIIPVYKRSNGVSVGVPFISVGIIFGGFGIILKYGTLDGFNVKYRNDLHVTL